MRLLTTLLAVVVAVAVVLFAVSNRVPVVLEFWPLPYRVEIGLYAAVLLAVLAGFVAGAVAAWLAGGSKRRELRLARRRIKELEQSLSQARQPSAPAPEPSPPAAAQP